MHARVVVLSIACAASNTCGGTGGAWGGCVIAQCLEWQCEKQRGDKNDKCPIVTLGAEWRSLVIAAGA